MPNGYGDLWVLGIRYYAHRAAWQDRHGRAPPKGKVICHSCHVRRCVNPDHLSLGSYAYNTQMSAMAGRMSRGSRRHSAILTEQQIPTIRLDPRPYSQISKDYGVSITTVWKVKNRIKWSHIA